MSCDREDTNRARRVSKVSAVESRKEGSACLLDSGTRGCETCRWHMGWGRTWFFGFLVAQASACGPASTSVPVDHWGDFHRTAIEAISPQTTLLRSVPGLPECTGEYVPEALAGDTGGAGAKTGIRICLGLGWWGRGGRRARFAGEKGAKTSSWRLCSGAGCRVGDGPGVHAGGGQLVVLIVRVTWHCLVILGARTRTRPGQPEPGTEQV